MWFINPRTVGLWRSLLQDAVDAGEAQGRKESQIIHQLLELKTLSQEDSIQQAAKAFKCPMEILFFFPIFQLLFPCFVSGSFHLDALIQQSLSIFGLFYCLNLISQQDFGTLSETNSAITKRVEEKST